MQINYVRFTIKTLAGAALCVCATALSPHAAAAPLLTGGYKCVDQMAGAAGAAAGCSATSVEASGLVAPVAAPVVPMAAPVPPVPLGVPPVVPPVPLGVPPVPLGPPPGGLPVGAPIPIAAPLAAPLAAGAVVADMSATGKGAPITTSAATVGPTPDIPTLPGPMG